MRPSDYISVSERPRYDDPPRIDGESVLLLGDCQIPFHDAAFINKCKELAFSWGVRRCVWGGDILDFATLSVFLTEAQDADEELDEDERYLAELASGFEHVDWLLGNHEARLRNRLAKWLDAERIRKMLGLDTTVTAHNYFYCLVGADWIVTHPKNASELPARVAMWIAEKCGRNVAMFHDHVTGISQTRDGEHIGVSVGMCADSLRMEYQAIRQSKRPAMTQGAAILRWDGARYWLHHLTAHTDFEWMKTRGQGETIGSDYGDDGEYGNRACITG